jgi:hypothetical protein
MSYDDLDLERLLARGSLGGPTYDRIESNVMRRVSPQSQRSRSVRRWAALLPAAAALAGVALYLGASSRTAIDSAGFTAKGSEASLTGAVELSCSGEPSCRKGDTLVFIVNSSIVGGYLNARARRIRPESTARIQLFPSEKGESPRLEAAAGTTVVPQGIRLGDAFSSGVYLVDVWFTDSGPSPDPGEGRLTSVEFTVSD